MPEAHWFFSIGRKHLIKSDWKNEGALHRQTRGTSHFGRHKRFGSRAHWHYPSHSNIKSSRSTWLGSIMNQYVIDKIDLHMLPIYGHNAIGMCLHTYLYYVHISYNSFPTLKLALPGVESRSFGMRCTEWWCGWGRSFAWRWMWSKCWPCAQMKLSFDSSTANQTGSKNMPQSNFSIALRKAWILRWRVGWNPSVWSSVSWFGECGCSAASSPSKPTTETSLSWRGSWMAFRLLVVSCRNRKGSGLYMVCVMSLYFICNDDNAGGWPLLHLWPVNLNLTRHDIQGNPCLVVSLQIWQQSLSQKACWQLMQESKSLTMRALVDKGGRGALRFLYIV